MALLYADSFRHYGTVAHMAEKWSTTILADSTLHTTGGRNDGAFMRMMEQDVASFTFPEKRTITVGVRLRGSTNASWLPVFWFANSSDVNLGFWLGANEGGGYSPGNILVHRANFGSGDFWTNPMTFDISQWHYYEMKVTCPTTGNLDGYIEVRLDGVTVVTAENVGDFGSFDHNIKAGIGYGITGSPFGGEHPTTDVCDFYINDDEGEIANGFVHPGGGGDVAVDYCPPNGAGASSQSTIGGSAPAATRWQGVDDTAPDDAVTYNAFTIDQKDLYTIDTSSLGPHALPSALQVVGRHNKTTAATSLSRNILRSRNAETESSDILETIAYDYHMSPVTADPKTGARITRKALANVQVGFRKTG